MVSAGAGYGVDPRDPICVGGGLVFGAFNEALYLQSLRCPDGSPVTFARIGSMPRVDAPPLDIYAASADDLAPVRLYLDMYQPMDDPQPPAGFAFESPAGPPRLPTSTVSSPLRPGESSNEQAEQPRRWRIVGQHGDTLGFAKWDGQDTVQIDLMANLAARVREHLDRALAITPVEQRAAVLDDFFERFLVLTSAGVVDARRDDEQVGPRPWHGPVWGRPARGPSRARRRFRSDRRPSRVEGRSAIAVAALFVLVPVLISAFALGQAWDDPVPFVLIAVAGAYVTVQCGRAFVTLLFAPVYPRETYYGTADIAPEPGDRAAVWRSHLMVAAPLVTLVGVALAWAVSGQRIGLAVLASAPVAIAFVVAGSKHHASLEPDRAVALERELRGRYVLYLRNFRGARPATAAACLSASAPHLMAMIVSPHRRESRSPSWYLLAIFMPRAFARLRLWSTDDAEWDRVVASCMARSVGILVDATGSSRQRDADGLTLEMAISLGFAGEHPTAYAVDPAKRLPVRVPAPATLHVGAGLGWTLLHHRALVHRLRAVLNRSLSMEENAYLEQFHRSLKERWVDAMVQDRAHAERLGLPEAEALLHMRRDQLPLKIDRPAAARSVRPSGTPE